MHFYYTRGCPEIQQNQHFTALLCAAEQTLSTSVIEGASVNLDQNEEMSFVLGDFSVVAVAADTTDIEINLTWSTTSLADQHEGQIIGFSLYKDYTASNGVAYHEATGTSISVSKNELNEWKGSASGISTPATDAYGYLLTYVLEVTTSGLEITDSSSTSDGNKMIYSITVGEKDTSPQINIIKQWSDDNNVEDRPANITINLAKLVKNNDEYSLVSPDSSRTVTLNGKEVSGYHSNNNNKEVTLGSIGIGTNTSTDIYIPVEGDISNYSVSSVDGTTVTISGTYQNYKVSEVLTITGDLNAITTQKGAATTIETKAPYVLIDNTPDVIKVVKEWDGVAATDRNNITLQLVEIVEDEQTVDGEVQKTGTYSLQTVAGNTIALTSTNQYSEEKNNVWYGSINASSLDDEKSYAVIEGNASDYIVKKSGDQYILTGNSSDYLVNIKTYPGSGSKNIAGIDFVGECIGVTNKGSDYVVTNEVYTEYFDKSSTVHNGEYSLGYILKNYNVFTEDYYNGQHVVGPVIVGGDFTGFLGGLTTGDSKTAAHTVSSYIGGTPNIGGGDVNMYSDELSFYMGTANRSKNLNIIGNDGSVRTDSTRIKLTDDFVNFDNMSKLKAEVAAIGTAGAIVVDPTNTDATLEKDGYCISGTTLEVLSDNVFDVSALNSDTFTSLKVSGDPSKDAIIYSSNSSFGIPEVNLWNGTEYYQPTQVETNGTGAGIVFALPNATQVTTLASTFTGHVVAPEAHVEITSGDYNGCVVAKSVNSNGEGHMWPYNGKRFQSGTSGIYVEKQFKGEHTWQDDEKYTFRFTREETTAAGITTDTMPLPKAPYITVTSINHKGHFPEFEFSQTGDYTYKFYEEIPAEATQNEDGTYTLDGIVYTNRVGYVTFTVSSKTEGDTTTFYVSETTVKYVTVARDGAETEEKTENSNTVFFVNKEETQNQETTATIKVAKTVTKKGDIDYSGEDEFEFTLTAGAGSPAVESPSKVSVTKDHDASFGTITFTAPGTYAYTISETDPEIAGMDTADDKTVYVKVTSAADGSLTAKVVDSNGESATEYSGGTVPMENEYTKNYGSAKLTKTAEGDGIALEEAEFDLYKVVSDGDDVKVNAETLATDDNGEIIVGNLTPGERYYFVETKAPAGYVLPTDGTEKTNDQKVETEKTTPTQLNFEMTNAKTNLSVSKVDITDGRELSGATIQIIEKSTNEVVESWTSGTEPHLVTGLKTNTDYILHEDVAPDGYTVASDTEFSLAEDGTVYKGESAISGNHLLIEDSLSKIRVSKVDIADGKELAGAKIQILNKEEYVIDQWTSTDSVHVISGLKTEEEYILRETVAPEGYSVTTDTKFILNKDGTVTPADAKGTATKNDSEGNVVLLVQDRMIALSILKKSSDGSVLSGAEFKITTNDGTSIDEWTSNGTAHDLTGILVGGTTYTLHEVSSPVGYAEINDIEFTVNANGMFTGFDGLIDENGVVTLTDQKLVMNVNKTDMTGENELDGAIIELFDSTGNKLDSWTSKAGEKHDFGEKLNAEQTYTLRETTAPKGYGKVTDITFKVSKTGEITITGGTLEQTSDGTWIIKDELIDLKTVKTDASNGAGLGGAVLRVYANNGTKVDEWTSVAGEAHDIGKNLTPGGYFIREVTAPSGYNKVGDIKFTVDAQGKVVGLNLAKDANGNYIIADSRITSTPEETPEEPKTPETPKEPDKPKEEEEKPEDEDDEEEDEEIPEIPDIETPEGGHEEFYTDENGVEWVIVYGPDGKVLGRRRVLGAGRARTGDESNLPLWGGMAAASMLGIGAVALYTKRKREDEEE